MRKIIILLIPFILFGCSNKLEIEGKITEIKYNDILINKGDFNKIINLINKEYSRKEDSDLSNKLTIKTDKDIYYFSLNNNEIKYGGKVADNDKLNSYLQDLTKEYTDKNFYTIDYMKNYEANSNDQTILLDKTSNYIIINFGKKVSNFKINEIETNNDNYTEIDLLYSEDSVNENKIIIRKSIDYEKADIKISFENQYGYLISIIPFYNSDKDMVEFKTTIKYNH